MEFLNDAYSQPKYATAEMRARMGLSMPSSNEAKVVITNAIPSTKWKMSDGLKPIRDGDVGRIDRKIGAVVTCNPRLTAALINDKMSAAYAK